MTNSVPSQPPRAQNAADQSLNPPNSSAGKPRSAAQPTGEDRLLAPRNRETRAEAGRRIADVFSSPEGPFAAAHTHQPPGAGVRLNSKRPAAQPTGEDRLLAPRNRETRAEAGRKIADAFSSPKGPFAAASTPRPRTADAGAGDMIELRWARLEGLWRGQTVEVNDGAPARHGGDKSYKLMTSLDQTMLEPLVAAPFPFPEIRALDLKIPKRLHEVLTAQLRFLAAMEGPAQDFSLSAGYGDDGEPRDTRRYSASNTSAADMKSFVRDVLQKRAPEICLLHLHNDETRVQVHRNENANLGRSLHHVCGEFHAALTTTYNRGVVKGDYELLRGLVEIIGSWCFDGSTTALNKYMQENALSEDDLSLVPNLDNRKDGTPMTTEEKAYEYLRVFRLYQGRLYYAKTNKSENVGGELAPEFQKDYYNAALFAKHLSTHESASALTDEERQIFRQSVCEMKLIEELSSAPE